MSLLDNGNLIKYGKTLQQSQVEIGLKSTEIYNYFSLPWTI